MKTACMYKHAEGVAGEVVLADISNPLQNPASAGKRRPVVLIEADGAHWWVMGLTTLKAYRNGEPRVPVPKPALAGLSGPGYLWGQLTRISVLDLDKHIGWVHVDLAAAIIATAVLNARQSSQLVRASEFAGAAA